MKKHTILIVIAVALIINAIFLGIIAFRGHLTDFSHSSQSIDSISNIEWRKSRAAQLAKQIVCKNLYYPNSYSLSELEVDSLFYGYMTDPNVVNQAVQLIEARSKVSEIESDVEQSNNKYLEAQNTLKVFGSNGVFWRHRKDRDEALNNLNIDKDRLSKAKTNYESVRMSLQNTLRNRKTTNDGNFTGWQVYCRYRAQTNNGTMTFGSVILFLDEKMKDCNFRYTIDDGNCDYDDIKEVIKQTLEKSNENY